MVWLDLQHQEPQYIIAVDPGRTKCGLAVVDLSGGCLARCVVERADMKRQVTEYIRRFPLSVVVVGDRTGSKQVLDELAPVLAHSQAGKAELVKEHLSSVEGRRLYLADHRKGWRRFWPLGLQHPAEPYDDYTAEVLAKRYLRGRTGPG